ncbi:hypothetical protein [Absidia glauca]|uniref:Integrase zinc-binding domain-containing protein n=1 Tax=Absidia glauca TaxID=4829 RepID=A0A163KDQ4_ABSGL|nr:hypothetical protein [Absidia glauca]
MQNQHHYLSQTSFDEIVRSYLANLSFKKRDKALIDRRRYNLILQVLQEPKNTAVSTAQFRFWVKKMFQLVTLETGRLVVCHDNKPVAIREQIYTILLWAHQQSHHGGRDKTSILVRQRFSWIPKELIARFVRHCPFCITRRNGPIETPLPYNPIFTTLSASSSTSSSPSSAKTDTATPDRYDLSGSVDPPLQPVRVENYDFVPVNSVISQPPYNAKLHFMDPTLLDLMSFF